MIRRPTEKLEVTDASFELARQDADAAMKHKPKTRPGDTRRLLRANLEKKLEEDRAKKLRDQVLQDSQAVVDSALRDAERSRESSEDQDNVQRRRWQFGEISSAVVNYSSFRENGDSDEFREAFGNGRISTLRMSANMYLRQALRSDDKPYRFRAKQNLELLNLDFGGRLELDLSSLEEKEVEGNRVPSVERKTNDELFMGLREENSETYSRLLSDRFRDSYLKNKDDRSKLEDGLDQLKRYASSDFGKSIDHKYMKKIDHIASLYESRINEIKPKGLLKRIFGRK